MVLDITNGIFERSVRVEFLYHPTYCPCTPTFYHLTCYPYTPTFYYLTCCPIPQPLLLPPPVSVPTFTSLCPSDRLSSASVVPPFALSSFLALSVSLSISTNTSIHYKLGPADERQHVVVSFWAWVALLSIILSSTAHLYFFPSNSISLQLRKSMSNWYHIFHYPPISLWTFRLIPIFFLLWIG